MPGDSTLVVTTRSGVRPLGVRGEPLHNAAPQLRRVVRRRLGDEAADLLADPQLHENDQGIDWYAAAPRPRRRAEPAGIHAAGPRSGSWHSLVAHARRRPAAPPAPAGGRLGPAWP